MNYLEFSHLIHTLPPPVDICIFYIYTEDGMPVFSNQLEHITLTLSKTFD